MDDNNVNNQEVKTNKLRKATIVLSVLLLLSVGALAVTYVYQNFLNDENQEIKVPDNLIGKDDKESDKKENDSKTNHKETEQEKSDTTSNGSSSNGKTSHTGSNDEKAKVLELYRKNQSDNEKFEARNMFPGDSESKYFGVKVYHGKDLDLFFRSMITEQSKELGDVLMVKVTHLDTGKVLLEGSFNEINEKEVAVALPVNSQKESIAYYRIDVSLDTAVGNEYQDAMLKADFEWFVDGDNGLTPPTGDTTNTILWYIVGVTSLILIVVLWKRRKEDKQNEQSNK